MNIIFYSHTGSLGNGGAESLLSIVSWFALRYKCLVITPDEGTLNIELTKRNIQNKVLPYYWASNFNNFLGSRTIWSKLCLIRVWILRLLTNKKYVNQHVSSLRSFNPSIIYSNTSVINMGLLVAKSLKIHHVWHLREFQVYPREFPVSDFELFPDFGWWYFKKNLNKSDIVITNSSALKKFYSNFLSKKKIKIVYNGIAKLENVSKKTETIDYMFLMVGTLSENKGHRCAILAARQLLNKGYNFKIDIVGAGKLKNKFEVLIKDLELNEIVKLHGQSSDVSSFYRKADCYLMCSNSESFGRVTVEAMLHKLPVIGRKTKFSATEEIIRDNIDGLLYKELNELEVKMEYMLNNKKQGIKMGLVGYERAMENFALEISLVKIEKILLNA